MTSGICFKLSCKIKAGGGGWEVSSGSSLMLGAGHVEIP